MGTLTDKVGRRGFVFSWLGLGWLAFSGAFAALAAGTARMMFPNVLLEPPQVFRAGYPEEYAVGEVSLRWKERFGVWVVRTPQEMYALVASCTHLGCTPNWVAGEGKFKCPCHGSGFDKAGLNLEGPAPRPLERCGIRLAPDGEIVIDKSRRFLQEKNQWQEPGAFLVL
jgi:cytochrome b6-f complex iron-sulfur subunit